MAASSSSLTFAYLQSRDKHLRYEKIKEVGEGTYGVVSSALDKETGKIVALKKVRMVGKGEDGVHFTTLREIKALRELVHPNILRLEDVYLHKGSIYLVYEYCTTDLEQVIRTQNFILTPGDIKTYLIQLLRSLDYCHKNYIVHRDLKPSNLLIKQDPETKEAVLKLADFGLAKVYGSPNKSYTPTAITRWYRPPELLFGSPLYGPSADIWSVGCIFAELMLRVPLFPGDNDLDQIGKIFACLGTPSEAEWPGMTSLPHFIEYEPFQATPFKVIFSGAGDDAVDLISKMLVFDPAKRITAANALKHPFFTNPPKPTALIIPEQLQNKHQKHAPFPKQLEAQEQGEVVEEMDAEDGDESMMQAKRKLSFEDIEEEEKAEEDNDSQRSVRRRLEL